MEHNKKKAFGYLIEKASVGDPDSFSYFYQTYASPIYRFFLFKTGKKEVAEDLMQDAFLKLYRAHKEGYIEELTKSYLFTITRNTLTDYYRKKKSVALDEEMSEKIIDERQDPKGDFDRTQSVERLHKALDILTEDQKEVIILRFIQDLSNHEIADILGKKEDAIRQLQARAIKTLRTYFKENGYEQ